MLHSWFCEFNVVDIVVVDDDDDEIIWTLSLVYSDER